MIDFSKQEKRQHLWLISCFFIFYGKKSGTGFPKRGKCVILGKNDESISKVTSIDVFRRIGESDLSKVQTAVGERRHAKKRKRGIIGWNR